MIHMQGYGHGPPSPIRHEHVFFAEGGVQVTSARFTVHQQMYPVAAITSVSPFSLPASKGAPIGLVLIFGFFFSLSLAGLINGPNAGSFVSLVVTGAFVALGVFWYRSRKPTHVVMITTSGMQARVLSTLDPAFAHRVVIALNQAVISR
jgi:hypothetical protein